MGLFIVGGVLATIWGLERSAALLRKTRMERRRAESDYPITGNDPVGRTIV